MFNQNSLVLYKNHPARLVLAGDRLEIELHSGETVKVRPKDVTLLHPGPLKSLRDLRPQAGEVHTAWEILAGEHTTLAELAELIYGAFTPATAWAAWQHVSEGLYFEGTPEEIKARSAEEVARRQLERDLAEARERAWRSFIERARRGEGSPEDHEFLREVENLAYVRSTRSAVLRELGRAETPENAHALLLELGAWDTQVNPYPARLGAAWKQPDLPIPALLEEERLDLTGLLAFAIDDEGSDTPDDAISLEDRASGPRLWVHVADVAALVTPGSPLDQEARERAESLHLPEGTIHLFPRAMTLQLGLGLQEISPALSFGFDLNPAGEVTGFEIVPSLVKVTRLTYAAAEQLMDTHPFAALEQLANAIRQRRIANGAVMLDFPEVKIHVEDGQVDIRPLPVLRSRMLVEECMILTGIQTARYAGERGLRLAFSQQEPPETNERPASLSGMFGMRRLMKRSQYRTTPGPHGGLGAPAYTQVTSPLRRYLDLVGHQQLRAHLRGTPLLGEGAVVERIGSVEAVLGALRQAENLSEKHWTLVYLLQHPDWRGEGILVDTRGTMGILLIPSLALETRVNLPRALALDALAPLMVAGIDLPQLDARFRIVPK